MQHAFKYNEAATASLSFSQYFYKTFSLCNLTHNLVYICTLLVDCQDNYIIVSLTILCLPLHTSGECYLIKYL